MKTIKLEIKVYGYATDTLTTQFVCESESASVECVNTLDKTAIDFLLSVMPETAYSALGKYYNSRRELKEAV